MSSSRQPRAVHPIRADSERARSEDAEPCRVLSVRIAGTGEPRPSQRLCDHFSFHRSVLFVAGSQSDVGPVHDPSTLSPGDDLAEQLTTGHRLPWISLDGATSRDLCNHWPLYLDSCGRADGTGWHRWEFESRSRHTVRPGRTRAACELRARIRRLRESERNAPIHRSSVFPSGRPRPQQTCGVARVMKRARFCDVQVNAGAGSPRATRDVVEPRVSFPRGIAQSP
jgi:hypothetical protein